MTLTLQASGTKVLASAGITAGAGTTSISKSSHGLAVGDSCQIQPGIPPSTLYSGLTAGTTYYVIPITGANAFTISATPGGSTVTVGTLTGSNNWMTSEAVIADIAAVGSYVCEVDLSAMVAGDVVQINAYAIMLTGGTRQIVYQSPIYSDAQVAAVSVPMDSTGLIAATAPIPNELTDAGAVRFTLAFLGSQKADGVTTSFPWKVLKFA